MTAITFEAVCKTFKTSFKISKVLSEISFNVRESEIFGFLGPNGAGKSTLIKILLNFISADSGRVTIQAMEVGKEPFQHHIGFLPETPCFFENLTGLETLWFSGKASGMASAEIRSESMRVLERLNLAHAGGNPVRTYSKGMKQRLGIAIALLHNPDVYILDEPMSGLDPMGRHLVADVILELRDKGKTVFFSSHILSDIERLCNRVGIINKGNLLYCGSLEKVKKNNETMEDAFIRMIRFDEESKRA